MTKSVKIGNTILLHHTARSKDSEIFESSLKGIEHPNIILIVIDALRARNLSCYGGDINSSPNIDKIANKGIQFENCYSCWNTTDQSLTSIFTGRYPRTHGIIHHGDKIAPEDLITFEKLNVKLLSEILQESGFKTFAIDWMSRWFKRGFNFYGYDRDRGLWQKFIHYFFTLPYVHLRYVAANIALLRIYAKRRKTSISSMWKGLRDVWNTFKFTFELARIQDAGIITKLGQHVIDIARNDKFFLFLHYWDTHTPYNCPKKYMPREKSSQGSVDLFSSKYKGAVSYVDWHIGKLLESLKNHNILENTLIIITSDHGESLTEHDIFFDHHGLYEVTTHIPLIIYNPNLFSGPKKIKGLAQHVDLVPTLYDFLGIDFKDQEFDGTSLVPLIYGDKEEIRKFALFEESYVQRKIGLKINKFKYIYAPDAVGMCNYCQKVHAGVEEFYDLEKDPDERVNVIDENKKIANQMRKEIDDLIRNLDKKKQKTLEEMASEQTTLKDIKNLKYDKKMKKKLRSLGYMD